MPKHRTRNPETENHNIGTAVGGFALVRSRPSGALSSVVGVGVVEVFAASHGSRGGNRRPQQSEHGSRRFGAEAIAAVGRSRGVR